MRRILNGLYEVMMISLVILTIMSIWNDNLYNNNLNLIVWAIFTVDFIVRFVNAKNKWKFLRKHPFLVIAIIPLDQFFQTARIIRVIYLFRIKTIAKYYVKKPLKEKMNYQSITRIVFFIFCLLILEGIIIFKIESSIPTVVDGFLVVFSQLLFFGRQLFDIEQSLTIFSLTITSMLGIIIQGIALQWVFGKIERRYKQTKQSTKKRKSS